MTTGQLQSPHEIAAKMDHVMQRAALPQKARLAGTDLLRRLSSPVRVTLFGAADSGKSTLLNVLCGRTLVPTATVKCPISLTQGNLSKTVAVSADGDRAEFDGVDINAAAALEPAIINVEIPLASLQDISLLEMNVDPKDPEIALKMQWAINRTDICLWCSRGFTKTDGALWQHIPDTLKDHAYLVITKVDQLAAPGALKDHLTALAPVINSEFHSVLPVAGRAALAALEARDQEIDVARWTGSGADALTTAIQKHAARGRREDLDNAQLFLARFGADTASPEASRPEEAPSPAKTRPADATTAKTAPKVANGAQQTVSPPAKDNEQARDLWLGAAQTLCTSAETIAKAATIQDPAERQNHVLETCLECIDNLTGFAEENADALGNEIVDDLMEASEVITLIQLEGGENLSHEAVSILVQLKTEFEFQAVA